MVKSRDTDSCTLPNGWFIANLIARVVATLLRTVKFNDSANRAGISEFVRNTCSSNRPSRGLAGLLLWFVRLIVLVVAFDALGLLAVSRILQQFLLWLLMLLREGSGTHQSV